MTEERRFEMMGAPRDALSLIRHLRENGRSGEEWLRYEALMEGLKLLARGGPTWNPSLLEVYRLGLTGEGWPPNEAEWLASNLDTRNPRDVANAINAELLEANGYCDEVRAGQAEHCNDRSG